MRVLLTRPKHQAQQLVHELESAGYETDCLPLLEIVPFKLAPEEIDAIASRIAQANKLIAVSANAARNASMLLQSVEPKPEIYAIGPSTASVLRSLGLQVSIPSGIYNSESLLAMTDFDVIAGQKVIILCGQGGRDYLEEKLTEKQAHVLRVELYERKAYPVELLDVVSYRQPDALTAMSGDTVEALEAAIEYSGLGSWKNLPLIVPGNRVRLIAEKLGFQKIYATEKPTTESLLQKLGELPDDV